MRHNGNWGIRNCNAKIRTVINWPFPAEMDAPFNGDDVKSRYLLPGISVLRTTLVKIRPYKKIGGVIHTIHRPHLGGAIDVI